MPDSATLDRLFRTVAHCGRKFRHPVYRERHETKCQKCHKQLTAALQAAKAKE